MLRVVLVTLKVKVKVYQRQAILLSKDNARWDDPEGHFIMNLFLLMNQRIDKHILGMRYECVRSLGQYVFVISHQERAWVKCKMCWESILRSRME